MLNAVGRPLLASSSKCRIPQGPNSGISRQIRQATTTGQKGFTAGPTKKIREKPKRDQVSGAFLPLPPNQVEVFGGIRESPLENLPQWEKSVSPSSLTGTAVRLPPTHKSIAESFGLPRNILVDFRLLSTPVAVSRRITNSLANRLNNAGKGSSEKHRVVLTGSAGCGKSYALLQAVNYAALNDWIVLYIPRAHYLVNSSTSYFYDAQSQLYLQPTASNDILKQLRNANKKVEALRVTSEVVFDRRKPVPAGEPLKTLFDIASTEQYLAPRILSIVLEELGQQEKNPVLLAVDEFQALYNPTQYKNQHYEPVKSYHLSLPRLLMEYASGKRCFKRGAFIGSITSSLTHYPVPTELKKALDSGHALDPYAKLNSGLLEYTKGLKNVPVSDKLEYDEAASLFEIWSSDRALHTRTSDELFLSKLSESSGNARAFVHGGLLATQLS